MNKFKVGDRVKYTSGQYGDDIKSNPLWGGRQGYIVGTVDSTNAESSSVKWDNGTENGYLNNAIELLDEKPEKVKLTKRGQKVVEDYFLGRGKWARKDADDGELKHGDRVSCTIHNNSNDQTYHISDAMISVNSFGDYHICHNIEECAGLEAEDLCGYEFSWVFEKKYPSNSGVTNIKKI